MKKKRVLVYKTCLIAGIILLILIGLGCVYYFLIKDNGFKNEIKECESDSDCVPGGCCHPNSCVAKENAPDCKNIICSMVCSGPLDCNAGYCGCVKGGCEVIPNK